MRCAYRVSYTVGRNKESKITHTHTKNDIIRQIAEIAWQNLCLANRSLCYSIRLNECQFNKVQHQQQHHHHDQRKPEKPQQNHSMVFIVAGCRLRRRRCCYQLSSFSSVFTLYRFTFPLSSLCVCIWVRHFPIRLHWIHNTHIFHVINDRKIGPFT